MDVAGYDFSGVGKRMVEYIWDPLPRNDDTSGATIWCLGKEYSPQLPRVAIQTSRGAVDTPREEVSSISQTSPLKDSGESGSNKRRSLQSASDDRVLDEGGWPPTFLDDFGSRVWLTYRSNFPPIPRSQDPKASSAMSFTVRLRSQFGNPDGFTTDTGWGCMIRSGQSLLANSLLLLHLGRDWRRGQKPEEERQWLSLFTDDPKAPFSIHRFVEHGASACGKHPGEWFGPSATARCISALATAYEPSNLRVYSTGDTPDVYEDALLRVAKDASGKFSPTLVLVGTRLGIDRITPVYWQGLETIFQLPQAVGIAGGRTRASHYFVGNQGSHFFYLDPHHTRPAVTSREPPGTMTDEEESSFYTRRLRRIHIREMDPSMLMGFLIRDEADWREWQDKVKRMPGKAIIHFAPREPTLAAPGGERASAIDEVESFDEDGEDD